MALKGTLKDFPLSDIFQLIGQQRKSGSLFIKNSTQKARIIFDDGKVILCTFLESDSELLLGNMLLNSQVVTAVQLQEAVIQQKAQGRSIGDTLIQLKYITSAILAEFIKLQIDEILFRIFEWDDGFYEFIAEKIKFNKNIIEAQSAEAVLMESFRKKDEWPKILSTIESLDNVFVMNRAALNTIKNPEDRKVAELFDGERNLKKIIHLSRIGTFECARITAELIRNEHLRKNTFFANQKSAPAPSTKFTWIQSNIWLLLIALTVAVILPFLMLRSAPQSLGILQSPESLKRSSQAVHIEELLKVYKLEHGFYPTSLEDLPASGIQFEHWNYEKSGERYKLDFLWTKP